MDEYGDEDLEVGEQFGFCSCGGYVRAYPGSGIVGHTIPLSLEVEHITDFEEFLFWDYRIVDE